MKQHQDRQPVTASVKRARGDYVAEVALGMMVGLASVAILMLLAMQAR